MKKRTLVNLVLLILLLFGATVSKATGEDEVMLGNWDNPATGQFIKFFGNQMTVILFEGAVLKGNLIVTTASNQIPEIPPMHVEYAFGPYSGILGPVDAADLVPITLSNGEQGYQQTFQVEFAFVDECDAVEQGIFILPVSFSLVTPHQGGYVVYPILQHPNFFPPGWFKESTFPFPPPAMSGDKFVDCVGYTTSRGAKTEGVAAKKASLIQNLSPNPFEQEFKLTYFLHHPSSLNMELVDMTGKLRFEKSYMRREAGLHEEILSMDQLLPGFYWMRLSTPHESRNIQLIKN